MQDNSLRPKKVSESKAIMSEMIMPNDTNPIHNLMGGNLLRWMDVVAAICAGKHCESYVVTVSVDQVSFEHPIPMGDVITLTAVVTRAFKTSVEVFVEVFSADIKGRNPRKCNEAFFTFVAVDDEQHRPQPVPEVIPLTGEEQKRFQDALQRRQMRLLLAGRIRPEEATEWQRFFKANEYLKS